MSEYTDSYTARYTDYLAACTRVNRIEDELHLARYTVRRHELIMLLEDQLDLVARLYRSLNRSI
jgi:hypothetical protein